MQFIIKVTSACNLSCTYCSEGLRQLENLNIETYKRFVDGLKISIEEKQELETIFNEAIETSKNEFLEIGFLYGKEK